MPDMDSEDEPPQLEPPELEPPEVVEVVLPY